MQEQFERMFNHKAKEYTSPLEKGDHLETDTSEELDANGIKMYQSLIGSLQWAVSLGRFDIIHTATQLHLQILIPNIFVRKFRPESETSRISDRNSDFLKIPIFKKFRFLKNSETKYSENIFRNKNRNSEIL
jgi:hypothetical protein